MRQLLRNCALMLVLVVAFSGCATYLPGGFLYTEVTAPIALGDPNIEYSKTGTAMATSILGLVATGDTSVRTAMNNGGITKVKYVEYHVRNILGFMGEYTTTVYGD